MMWWPTLSIALSLSTATASLTYKGVDWSSTLVEEESGRTYSGLDGTSQPLEGIFKDNGVNAVRQRIWNNPADGNYNLDYNLELGRRANEVGLEIFLDFHYSDTWADPAHQTTPSAWEGYDLQGLASAVKSYTKSVLDEFASAGLALSIVSIGNEITAGLLWPVGDIDTSDGPFNVATLLHAASAGVRESSLASQPKIMIHLDNGWNWETQKWWYDAVLGENVLTLDDFDVQGVSYYPFYNSEATLSALETSLGNMRSTYGGGIPTPTTGVLEIKLTFKEGGAFDFHTTFERVKERLQQAVEVSRISGDGTGSSRAAMNGVDISNVNLEDLPAYQEESDGPLISPVGPPPAAVAATSQQSSNAQRDSGVAVDEERPRSKPTEADFGAPTEPPPGYEETQIQGLQDEMDRRASEGARRS
ncbi:hypothetical protein BTJ68_03294 [Hortaea werneckii EXF-2000]|uniref:Arabinogalactan endo-beta-1,4-galactanase n=1 Tax=Hortaea werneckii EXF-2000 TaxID=1157616 RepID=A0A1Z5TKX7_HORWE|nr:hypothetical protein BTJ68_03294 [Hortaea werneckii EXF-2000]